MIELTSEQHAQAAKLSTYQAAYDRHSFEVKGRTFTKVRPGVYTDGTITVCCDQQDSTSWAARIGGTCTGYHWMPEYAVERLLYQAAQLSQALKI